MIDRTGTSLDAKRRATAIAAKRTWRTKPVNMKPVLKNQESSAEKRHRRHGPSGEACDRHARGQSRLDRSAPDAAGAESGDGVEHADEVGDKLPSRRR
jgi:hypothetical protein